VIEEQSRVEVIPEIDQELQSVLADFDVFATLVEAAVFLAALAALARLQRHMVARNSQRFASDAHGFAQPRAREIFIDRRRRLVFLDVQVVLARQRSIDVDGRCIFGQVGIVDAPAVDSLTLGALAQMAEVFLDAVLQHLRARRERFRRHGDGIGRRDFE